MRTQQRQQVQAENARRRRWRHWRKTALHYFIFIAFLLGVGTWLSINVFFKIEKIEVVGADQYTPDEIIAASGIELQTGMFQIDKSEVEESLLQQFPAFAEIHIHRKLMGTVEIEVTQANPVAAIVDGDELVMIDGSGKVLGRGKVVLPENVLILKGVNVEGVQPGETLGQFTGSKEEKDMTKEELQAKERAQNTKEKLTALTCLLEAADKTGFTGLTNLDLTDRRNIKVKYENRLVIELGSEVGLVDKLTLIQHILETYIEADAKGTVYAAEVEKRQVRFRPDNDENNDVLLTMPKKNVQSEA